MHAKHRLSRPALLFTVAAAFSLLAAAPAEAKTDPQVKALQVQVKKLNKQVTTLTGQVQTLQGTVGELQTTLTTLSTAATPALAKVNCLVNATALVLWTNDVYVGPGHTMGELFFSSGVDIASASDQVSGYVAGINPSCVPSVFPRAGQASFTAYQSRAGIAALFARLPL